MKISNSIQRTGRKKAAPNAGESTTLCLGRPRTARLRAGLLCLWIVLAGWTSRILLAQATYSEGDLVEDFTLVNRTTGEPLSLSDFEGSIIFLEWFAWW